MPSVDQIINIISLISFLFSLIIATISSAAEIALTSANIVKLNNLKEKLRESSPKIEILIKLIKDKTKVLTVIVIVNTIVILVADSIAAAFAHKLGTNITVTTIIVTLFILIFCEIVPKAIAAHKAEKIGISLAKYLYWQTKIIYPFTQILVYISSFFIKLFGAEINPKAPFVTEDELKMMVNMSQQEGILEKEEKEMIESIFIFTDTIAKEIMVPRVDMCVISIKANLDEIINLAKQNGYSRLPVYEKTIDNIVGIIYIKDILFNKITKETFNIKNIMRKPFFVPETKGISQVLKDLQNNKISMAIVIDEYGGTAGLITIEDILEEIVGEIVDEYDKKEEDIKKLSDNEYIVNGNINLEDLQEKLNLTILPQKDIDTLAGLIYDHLGHIPKTGEKVKIKTKKDNTLILEVKDVIKQRIAKIHLRIYTKREDLNERKSDS